MTSKSIIKLSNETYCKWKGERKYNDLIRYDNYLFLYMNEETLGNIYYAIKFDYNETIINDIITKTFTMDNIKSSLLVISNSSEEKIYLNDIFNKHKLASNKIQYFQILVDTDSSTYKWINYDTKETLGTFKDKHTINENILNL